MPHPCYFIVRGTGRTSSVLIAVCFDGLFEKKEKRFCTLTPHPTISTLPVFWKRRNQYKNRPECLSVMWTWETMNRWRVGYNCISTVTYWRPIPSFVSWLLIPCYCMRCCVNKITPLQKKQMCQVFNLGLFTCFSAKDFPKLFLKWSKFADLTKFAYFIMK